MTHRILVTCTTIVVGLSFCAPTVRAQKIYWTDQGTAKIQRADLDGSNVEDLVTTGLVMPSGIALDLGAGKMYWKDEGADKIQRADLDGSNVEDVVATFLQYESGIALDLNAGKIYWTSFATIQRANLDGTEVEELFNGWSFGSFWRLPALALDLDAGKMYWSFGVFEGGGIQRANLDGSNVEDLLSTAPGPPPEGIALDLVLGKMYWTDGNIARANLDGSNVEYLKVRGGIFALDLDAGKIYETFGAKIRRVNLDGTDVEDVVTGLSNSTGIALDLGPPDPDRITGTCCDGKTCLLDTITQPHCEGTFAGALFQANITCGDPCACRCQLHGDVFPAGPPQGNCVADIDDLLVILAAFADSDPCVNLPGTNIFPCDDDCPPGAVGKVDIDDVVSELGAFAGDYSCSHPCPP